MSAAQIKPVNKSFLAVAERLDDGSRGHSAHGKWFRNGRRRGATLEPSPSHRSSVAPRRALYASPHGLKPMATVIPRSARQHRLLEFAEFFST